MSYMKRILLITLILFFNLIAFSQSTERKSKKELRAEKKEKIEKSVQELLKTNQFTFVVRKANPTIGPSITLTSDYEIKISGDSVNSYLPYFGEAYRIEYGDSDGGIKFKTHLYDYEIEFNEKKKFYEIQFKVIEAFETYRVYLNISSSGYGNLKIMSNARQAISYDGILDMLLK